MLALLPEYSDPLDELIARALRVLVEETEKPVTDWARLETMWSSMSDEMFDAMWDAFSAYYDPND